MEYVRREVISYWYQSWQPSGLLWCETQNQMDFDEYNRKWRGEGQLDKCAIPIYRVVGPKEPYEG